MKKIFSILIMLAISLTGMSQINTVTTMTGGGDTISNSGTDHVDSRVQTYAKTVSIQAKVVKGSGTIAGTGLLQGSNDGVNYVNIGVDTMSLTNQTTNTKIWVLNGSPYEYYRITYLGSGTMKAAIYGYILPNKISGATNSVSNMSSSYGLTKDTVTNSGTNSLLIRVQQWFETVSIQAVVTKISGTAAGAVTLQGSNDGLNFVTVSTKYLTNVATLSPYTVDGTATLSIANQTTNTKIFTVTGSPYEYYRLSYTGSGTMVCTLKGYVLANR